MSDTYDLLTLAEGKRALKIGPNSTDKDTQLAMYITGVSRAMDDTFGPSVNRTVTGELHDGGVPVIFPRKWPVSSVTSVVEYDQTTAGTLTAESATSQPTDSYLLDSNGISIRRRNAGSDTYFASGRRNIYVTYVAGRAASTSAVDAQFKLGAALFLKNVWRAEEQGLVELDEFDVPRQNFPSFAVPNAVKDLLKDYLQAAPEF